MADGSLENIMARAVSWADDAGGSSSPLLRLVPGFEKIDGWLKLDVSELLFAAAASVKTGCIIEVGSYRGRSTIALAAGSIAGSKIPVFAIEPHEHFIGAKGGVFGPSDRRAFFKNILLTKFSSIVRLINTTSDVIAPGWNKPVSLLFIDGDHRYDAVLSDFTVWRPHLVDGAIVVFHDVPGTGTTLLINDLLKLGRLTPVQTVGRLAMFRFEAVDSRIEQTETPRRTTAPARRTMPGQPTANTVSDDASGVMFYSANGNYLYREIPHCACTTIRLALREFEALAGVRAEIERPRPDVIGLNAIGSLTPTRRVQILSEAAGTFKFAMVRDPYARLVSAYQHKIIASYDSKDTDGIDRIKAAANSCGIEISERMTFEEFVRVVSSQPYAEMDAEWKPQYVSGGFDEIDFDFIGRVEAISTDLPFILEQIGAPLEMMHRAIAPSHVAHSRLGLWSLVGSDTRKAFLKTFAADFENFRYPLRHSGIFFSTVTVDKPKPLPLALPNQSANSPRDRSRRKAAHGHKTGEKSAAGDDGDGR